MKQIFIFFLFTLTLSAIDMRSLLFHGNCITCHAEHKTVSAPSITLIKEKYLQAFPQKKEFITFMSQWILTPNKETSIMLDSIQKHGLMPELGYDISTLEEISAYIYETDFTHKE